MTISSIAITDQRHRPELSGHHRVVLADDHPLYRRGLAWALSSSGKYQVVAEAENGLQALEAIRGLQPDLIILDIRMPELGGLETLRELRAEGDETPVVLLSAFDEMPIYLAGMLEGATAYLNKDLSRQSLVESLDELVARLRREAAGSSRPPRRL